MTQQSPKEAYAAENFGHWKFDDRKGRWFSVPDPKQHRYVAVKAEKEAMQ